MEIYTNECFFFNINMTLHHTLYIHRQLKPDQQIIQILHYKSIVFFFVNQSAQSNIHTPSDANGAPMAMSLLTWLISPTLAASRSFLPNSVSVVTWEVSRWRPDTKGGAEGLLLANPPVPTKQETTINTKQSTEIYSIWLAE